MVKSNSRERACFREIVGPWRGRRSCSVRDRRSRAGAGQAQGRLHLCRPGRRPRLELPARPGPPGYREGASATRSRPPLSRTCRKADSERAIEQLARTGHKLIFTTSFGFMEPTLKVAKKYPNVKFEHATGFKRAPNLATYAAQVPRGPLRHRPDRRQDDASRTPSAMSAPSRSRKYRRASTPSSSARNR